MLAFVFPGQGSQSRGMGRDLFIPELYPPEVEAQVDRLVVYSLREMCLEGKDDGLRRTEVAQPCLFVVNALTFLRKAANGPPPAFLAGHSLGEYNALMAAGAFDPPIGLPLAVRRGALMGAAPKGAMAAGLGLDASAVARAIEAAQPTALDVANFNTPSQLVISGPAAEISQAEAALKSAGAGAVIPLQVSAPFHSRYTHNSIDEIDAKTRSQIEEKFFRRSFDDLWKEAREYHRLAGRRDLDQIDARPKQKVALIFKCYFAHSNRLAWTGSPEQRVDYQIQCGPALGAFNQWVKDGPLQSWPQRRVADIAERLMQGVAAFLNARFEQMAPGS